MELGCSAVLTLKLPWPPTVNTYYRNVNGRMVLSAKGRQYHNDVAMSLCGEQRQFTGRLKVYLCLVAPTARKHDIDNRVKAVLDALEKCGVIRDDEQVDELHVVRSRVEKPGWVDVSIVEEQPDIAEKPPGVPQDRRTKARAKIGQETDSVR